MPSLALALALLLPPTWLGGGVLLALGLGPRTDRVAWLGWAWVAGSLGLAALLVLFLLAGLPLEARWLLPAVLVAGAPGWIAGQRALRASEGPSPLASAPAWERAVFAVGLALVLAWCLGWIAASSQRPVTIGDEADWNMHAKVIFEAGDLGPRFREAMTREERFPTVKDYPILNPLLQVWAFAMAGGIVHTEVRLPVQLLHFALLLALAGALLRRVRPWLAAVLLVVFLALPQTREQLGETKADSMVALGLLVAADGWLRARETKERRFAALAALGGVLLVLAKHDGAVHLAALLAALALCARGRPVERARSVLSFALWPGLALAGTWAFNAWFGFTSSVLRGGWTGGPSLLETLVGEGPGRIGRVLEFYAKDVLLAPQETQLAFMLLLALALHPRARAALAFPALVCALALAGMGTIYLGTTFDLEWHLATSGVRTACQALPLALLGIAAGLATLDPERLGRARATLAEA